MFFIPTSPVDVRIFALGWVTSTAVSFGEAVLTALKWAAPPAVVDCLGFAFALESLKGQLSKSNSTVPSLNKADDVPQNALSPAGVQPWSFNERENWHFTRAPPHSKINTRIMPRELFFRTLNGVQNPDILGKEVLFEEIRMKGIHFRKQLKHLRFFGE